MRALISFWIVLFTSTANAARLADTPTPAATARNCVEADKLSESLYRPLFITAMSGFFTETPCSAGAPRIIVLGFTPKPNGVFTLDMTIGGLAKTVSGASIYEIIGRAVQAADGALSRQTAAASASAEPSGDDSYSRCARGKRLVEKTPTDAAALILSSCAKKEGDSFAERSWKEYEQRGLYDVAAQLAERIGLKTEAARLRGHERNVGYLNISARPWANVWIDGRDTGFTTPIRSLELRPGKHVVALKNDRLGCKSSFSIEIRQNETTSLIKALEHCRQ